MIRALAPSALLVALVFALKYLPRYVRAQLQRGGWLR